MGRLLFAMFGRGRQEWRFHIADYCEWKGMARQVKGVTVGGVGPCRVCTGRSCVGQSGSLAALCSSAMELWICLRVCLSVCLSVCRSVCLMVKKFQKTHTQNTHTHTHTHTHTQRLSLSLSLFPPSLSFSQRHKKET